MNCYYGYECINISRSASGPKHIQSLRLQIQEVHPVAHSSACKFNCFSYLSHLGYLSLLGLQRKTRKQSNSSIFVRSSHTTQRHSRTPRRLLLCMLLASAHTSDLCKRWHSWFPWMDSHVLSTIQ